MPKSGGPITGTSIYRNVDNDSLEISGGLGWNHGAMLALRGKDLPQADGEFSLIANDGNSFVALTGKTNTSLTWGGKNIECIEEQGDGYIRYANGLQICWGIKNFSNLTFSEQWGDSVLISPELTITYSKTFTSAPACSLFMSSGWSSWVMSSGETSTPSTVYFKVARPKGSTDSSVNYAFVNMSYIAIGKWR